MWPGQSWSMSSLEGRVTGMGVGGGMGLWAAVLTHLSLAGGLDLEKLPKA